MESTQSEFIYTVITQHLHKGKFKAESKIPTPPSYTSVELANKHAEILAHSIARERTRDTATVEKQTDESDMCKSFCVYDSQVLANIWVAKTEFRRTPKDFELDCQALIAPGEQEKEDMHPVSTTIYTIVTQYVFGSSGEKKKIPAPLSYNSVELANTHAWTFADAIDREFLGTKHCVRDLGVDADLCKSYSTHYAKYLMAQAYAYVAVVKTELRRELTEEVKLIMEEANAEREREEVKLLTGEVDMEGDKEEVKMITGEAYTDGKKEEVKLVTEETNADKEKEEIKPIMEEADTNEDKEEIKPVTEEADTNGNKEEVKLIAGEAYTNEEKDEIKLVTEEANKNEDKEEIKPVTEEADTDGNKEEVETVTEEGDTGGEKDREGARRKDSLTCKSDHDGLSSTLAVRVVDCR